MAGVTDTRIPQRPAQANGRPSDWEHLMDFEPIEQPDSSVADAASGPVQYITGEPILNIVDALNPSLELPIEDLGIAKPLLGDAVDLVQAPSIRATPWRLMVKRGMDIVGSLLALVLLSPVLVIAGLAVALTSPGPILFVQERIGRDGRPFRMYKFRSMTDDAVERWIHHEHANERSGPIFKIRRDPRITPVGRVLRKLSIDELPQFVNVLRGDMSLVGPRPPLPGEFRHYGHREMQRLSVTPGMTCIWQVSGRSEIDWDEWIELDLQYIRTWSLLLDFKILLLTIPAVLSSRGAY
jgi:exopolysaccharide biosynthesis polyprenyl glycosylphosphotransferase